MPNARPLHLIRAGDSAASLDPFAVGARRLGDPDGPIPARRPSGDPQRPEPEHRCHKPGEPAEERDEGNHPQCPPPGQEGQVPRGWLLDDEPAEGETADHVADRVHEPEREEQEQPQGDPDDRDE
jgi:hypothetical protein